MARPAYPERRLITLKVQLSREAVDALRSLAARRGMSQSEVIRSALLAEVQTHCAPLLPSKEKH